MWQYLAIFVASLILTYVLTPKPKKPTAGTIEAPTAEEGRPVPVLFGSRWIVQTNILWYGDVSTSPVNVKVGK